MGYKLCLYDMNLWLGDKFDDLKVIAETDIEPHIGDNLEINGEAFHVSAKYPKGNLVGLKPIVFSDEPDEIYDEDFICPFCGSVDLDAFELSDEGTRECPSCGSVLEYSREVSIQYNVKPVSKKEAIVI